MIRRYVKALVQLVTPGMKRLKLITGRYKILVVNKSGVTCVFLFFCFVSCNDSCKKKSVDNFGERLKDCLKYGAGEKCTVKH